MDLVMTPARRARWKKNARGAGCSGNAPAGSARSIFEWGYLLDPRVRGEVEIADDSVMEIHGVEDAVRRVVEDEHALSNPPWWRKFWPIWWRRKGDRASM